MNSFDEFHPNIRSSYAHLGIQTIVSCSAEGEEEEEAGLDCAN